MCSAHNKNCSTNRGVPRILSSDGKTGQNLKGIVGLQLFMLKLMQQVLSDAAWRTSNRLDIQFSRLGYATR